MGIRGICDNATRKESGECDTEFRNAQIQSKRRMATIEEIRSKSEEYVQWDPVDSTREEIATLIKEERWEDLRIRIMNRLVFGTAGIRY